MSESGKWHLLSQDPKDLPMDQKHVIVCVGKDHVGEGYRKRGEWYRFYDFGPISSFMKQTVRAWMELPEPPEPEEETEEATENENGKDSGEGEND